MSRVPPKLYKIGEVMQYTGLSRQTIHNYTTLGLIQEETRTQTGDHRLYPETVFKDISKIKELKIQGKSLMEIRQVMEEIRKRRLQQEPPATSGSEWPVQIF